VVVRMRPWLPTIHPWTESLKAMSLSNVNPVLVSLAGAATRGR
jgi:hypothetical protein